MLILQLAGGLGNQLFQYGLYRALLHHGREVKIDDFSAYAEDLQREPVLERLGLQYERAARQEVWDMRDASPALSAKIHRKLFGRHKKAYFEESKRFLPQIFEWDDLYLEGYWQSEQYFADIADNLYTEYRQSLRSALDACMTASRTMTPSRVALQQPDLQQEASQAATGILTDPGAARKLIRETQSVAVHLRGGDYLRPDNQPLYGGICTDDYYRRAAAYIEERVPDCVFYIFSNDRDWALPRMKEDFPDLVSCGRAHLVSLAEENDFAEMALMLSCKHQIVANSSFSWWASCLNDNPGKIVCAPSVWLNGIDCADIYRKDMVKI